ncbi:MAG TPA: hypothetical protein VF691_13175, partial [Cytophagaceae bacterium]
MKKNLISTSKILCVAPSTKVNGSFLFKCLILVSICLTPALHSLGALRTWDGTVGNFSDPTKWSGGVVPGSADEALINAGTVTLTSSGMSIEGLKMTGGTLALQSFTLNVLKYTNIVASSVTATTSSTTGTLNCTGNSFLVNGGTHSANFVVVCEDIWEMKNTTFNGIVSFTKTGGSCNWSGGGTTYKQSATFIMNGNCGWEAASSGDVFIKTAAFKVGNSRLTVADAGNVTFNDTIFFEDSGGDNWFGNGGTITLNNNAVMIAKVGKFATGGLRIFRVTQLGTKVNDLMLTESASISIRYCTMAGSINSTFSSGDLRSNNVTGNVTMHATDQFDFIDNVLNGTNHIRYRYAYNQSNVFSGNPGATTTIIKRKSSDSNPFDGPCGGNTFHGVTYLTDSTNGNGFEMETSTSYGVTTYNKDVYMNSAGVGQTKFARAGNTTYNGNIYISVANLSDQVLEIGNPDGSGTATIASGKAIFTTGTTSKGYISLNYITQLGSTANVLTTTSNVGLEITNSTFGGPLTYTGGISSWVTIKKNSVFKENVSLTTSNGASGTGDYGSAAYLNSSTFQKSLTLNTTKLSIQSCSTNTVSGTTTITKNGPGWDFNNGGNYFKGVMTIENSGDGLFMGNSTGGDTYGGDITIKTSLSSSIYMSTSNLYTNYYNGNIYVVGQGTGNIEFGDNSGGGTSILANDKGISNPLAYTGGRLRITKLTQSSGITNTGHNLTLTGTATFTLKNSTLEGNITVSDLNSVEVLSSTMQRNVTITCSNIYFNSCSTNTVSGTTAIRKTGSGWDLYNGNNYFKGVTTIENSGDGLVMANSTGGDTYGDDITLKTSLNSSIYMSNSSLYTNYYNGNIYVVGQGTGNIEFGDNSGGGISILANNKGISNPMAYTGGLLNITRLTQLSGATNTGHTLTLTGTATFALKSSILEGNFTFSGASNVEIFNSILHRNNSVTCLKFVDIRGSSFNQTNTTTGTTTLARSGSTADNLYGSNTFRGPTTIINNATGASGVLTFSSTAADAFQSSLTLTNSGLSRIRIAQNGAS